MQYKVTVFKVMNPIPASFIIDCGDATLEQVNKNVLTVMNGNGVCFVDIKGRSRIYDRSIIRKILIREI